MTKFARILTVTITALALTACEGASPDIESGLTVIHGGTILTINGAREVIKDGVIVVEGDEIIAVGPAALASEYPIAKRIDADGGIIMPGMVNAHNHLSMVAFRGMAEGGIVDFEDRLVNYFFPLEAQYLNRDLIRVSARHAAIESALGGVTTIADMYYHEDEVAKSVKDVGLRGVLGETVIGFPVVDAPTPYGGLDYAEKFIQDWQGDALITPALAPHAPYTVSAEKLQATKALSDKYDAPILIHMDEVENEEQMTAEFGQEIGDMTIVEYLDDLGFLGENVLAAHTNYVTPSDIATLKARGVGVSHNPKANTKDMSGLSPAWQMYKDGLDIGLGTDGPMSSNQMDMLGVMPFALRIARIDARDIAKFDPEEIVEMATLGGAKALNMDGEIGSLEVGKKADIVILETRSPNMQPNYDPYATVVLSAYAANVEMTMVGGRIIAQGGTIRSVDLDAHQAEWDGVIETVAGFDSGAK